MKEDIKINDLTIVDLLCENLKNPIGIACINPHVSWKIVGDEKSVKQVAYQIQVALNKADFEKNIFIYDQTIESEASHAVSLNLSKIVEKTTYYWHVRVCVNTHNDIKRWLPWSDFASFETGLKDAASWVGKWIEADEEFYKNADEKCTKFWKKNIFSRFSGSVSNDNIFAYGDQGLRMVPYLKKSFDIKSKIRRARIYITARGLYELYINGSKIGRCCLAPDFTAYDKCIYYQTFDITGDLKEGVNHFDVILGDGWYVGHSQGIPGSNHLYGDRPSLLMQAEIDYEDGSIMTIASDNDFTVATGPLQYADLLMGEYYDLQSINSQIFGTIEKDYLKSVVMAQKGEMITAIEILKAKRVFRDAEGGLIVDFGQVIAGRERVRITGSKDSIITIEHSEEIDNKGIFYNVLPTFPFHDQKNIIHFAEEETIVYEPQFSFQGFRYIRISGLTYDINLEDCQAIVIGTGMSVTGKFECSNSDLNQLMKNIIWSQKGNMISIPTDCPQRERAGFTGDAQVFGKTAALNMDVSSFFERWLEQCRYEQLERGQIPIVVPYTNAYRDMEPNPGWTSAGWGDVIIFLPWDMYQAYGDIRFLKDNYGSMLRWMDYVEKCANDTMPEKYYLNTLNRSRQKYLWNTGFHWGDWLIPGVDSKTGAEMTKEITASLYYYREVKTIMLISKELGDTEKFEYFNRLSLNIYNAFHQEYIVNEEKLTNELQGLYVMAIVFDMVVGETRDKFSKRLNELVIEENYHLHTGFLSTPFLLDTLWECGYKDTAYRVLYQDTAPSWLFQVKNGATTMWEEWECKDKDGNLKGTSFNHYAFGCVADFIYKRIGGVIILDKGFKKILIQPEATEELTYAETILETIYGTLDVKWEKVNNAYRYYLSIPHNTTAVIRHDGADLELGSGYYEFSVPKQQM